MTLSSKTLGAYLKEQRELKGLSLDEAALETNIAKKYIEALERDEYGFFPAEMYATGFLSTYIEVLELDGEYVISMYQRAVSKEKEVPLEELYTLHQTAPDYRKYVRLGVFGALLVGVLSLTVWLIGSLSAIPRPKAEDLGKEVSINVLDLTQGEVKNFGVKDRVSLNNKDNTLSAIEFLGYGDNQAQIRFRVDQNEYVYKTGDNLNIDLSTHGLPNLSIAVNNVSDDGVAISFAYVQNVANALFDVEKFRPSIYNEIPLASVENTSNFTGTITAIRPVWVEIQADGEKAVQRFLNIGQNMPFTFIDGLNVSIGNAGGATISFNQFTNVVRGGITGETSQSIFYKKSYKNEPYLYRAQLK